MRQLMFLVVFIFFLSGQTQALQNLFSEQEVSFRNGDVVLAGTLFVPDGKGPFPTIVFLHGSGPSTREGAKSYARDYATLGIASLVYDKRGSGSSTGSWITSSLEDLARDAIAAVEFVKKQPAIDGKKIGFWGVSQAGWIAPRAASLSENISFMIIISGGGASPKESEMFSYQQAFRKMKLSQTEITDATNLIGKYFDYLETGNGRSELVTRIEQSKNSKWYPLARLDQILPSEGNLRNWNWVAAYDPLPDIEKIKCPTLLMFGELDTDHPTQLAIEKWKKGFENGSTTSFTIQVFKNAGHGIRLREGHKGKKQPPFAEGYFETMRNWLLNNVVNQ
jgi:uncharacterized protein